MSRIRKEGWEIWERVKSTVKPARSEKPLLARNEKRSGAAKTNAFIAAKSGPVVPEYNSVRKTLEKSSARPNLKAIDPGILRRISGGRITIEGRIDLHGFSQHEARQRLWRYINYAHQSDKRTILVITGKGPDGEGILRRSLPYWLDGDEFRHIVSGSEEAQLVHGGSGARYVRLYRNREINKN